MTLQDFVDTIDNSLESFADSSLPLILPLLAGLMSFLIGLLVARLLSFAIQKTSQLLSVEKSLLNLPGYKDLLKENRELSLTNLVSKLVWWVTLVIFLVAGLSMSGFSQTNQVLAAFGQFLPSLITGSFYLLMGLLLAYLGLTLVTVLGNVTKLPATVFLARAISAAIMIFSTLSALKAFGVSDANINNLIIAALVASTIAFGLAGKDLASDTLKKFKKL